MKRINIIGHATALVIVVAATCGTRSAWAGARQADFNGDGRADIAVYVQGETVSGFTNAGGVAVLYGRSGGLDDAGDQFWTQDSSGVNDSAEAEDHFGTALAAGDFDGDGFTDLAIGVPGEDVNGVGDAGAVEILYGSSSGLRSSGDQFWHRATDGVLGDLQTNASFGNALTAGDFNGDGRDDLAIGVTGQTVGGDANAGEVHILYGKSSGLSASGDQIWNQDSDEIEDQAEPNDFFGSALAAGDFDGNGRDDLAISAKGEDEENGAQADVGMVLVLYGRSGGLRSTGNKAFFQGEDGVINDAEAGDVFGFALAVGNFNGDHFDDLAISAPSEDAAVNNAGAVNVLFGSSNGLSGSGDQYWSQDTVGIKDAEQADDNFGWSLAAGDFDGDGFDDLAVGANQEAINGHPSAGSVNVIYGSASKLSASGNQFWHQDSTGIKDKCEDFDFFGWAMTAGDYDGDGRDDLAVSARDEDLGGIMNCGIFQVIYGASNGLNEAGNQLWYQDSPGIQDAADTNENLGAVMR